MDFLYENEKELNALFNDGKFILRDQYNFSNEKVIVKKEFLAQIFKKIKNLHPYNNYTIHTLKLSNAIYRGSSISLEHFDKLQKLSNRKIPHLKVLGRNDLVLYNLQKSQKVAEFVGILLGQASIYIKKSRSTHYSLVIYCNKKYHKDIRYVNYLKELLLDLFNISEDNGFIVNYNDNGETSNFTINRTVIVYEILTLGVYIDNISSRTREIPNWIFENDELIYSCLIGIINSASVYNISFREYLDKFDGRLSIKFQNTEDFLNGLQKLFESINISSNILTYETLDKKSMKYYTQNLIIIQKKEDIYRIISEIEPISWDIQKDSIINEIEKYNLTLSDVIGYTEKAIIDYSKEFAYNILKLFEMYGSYTKINEQYKNILGPRRIIQFLRNLFNEYEFLLAYGEDGYERWYTSNARILVDDDIHSIQIPFHILKQLYREIYQILDNNCFLINNSEVLEKFYDFFDNMLLLKIRDIKDVNIRKFGRLFYLINNPETNNLFEKYFYLMIELIRTIKIQTKYDTLIGYNYLAEKFDTLFSHGSYVKEIIEDLEDIFETKFKVGFTNEPYRWHRLLFRCNYDNLFRISNQDLAKRLGKLFDIIENKSFDKEMFKIINPCCSDFKISHNRNKPLKKGDINSFINKLEKNKLIIKGDNSFLGKKLIDFINFAENYYKISFFEDFAENFSNQGNIYHEKLQKFFLKRDKNLIATEVLVWQNVEYYNVGFRYISGHIDFLFYYDGIIYACDYKPDEEKKKDRNFLRTLPQVAFYGLILRNMLQISDLKIKCITFNKYHAWEFDPLILYSVVNLLDYLKQKYPQLTKEWEKYLDLFKIFFLSIDDS